MHCHCVYLHEKIKSLIFKKIYAKWTRRRTRHSKVGGSHLQADGVLGAGFAPEVDLGEDSGGRLPDLKAVFVQVTVECHLQN
jgi:hypothetical protein